MTKKNPSLTATQISEKIAGFFNHASDINMGYLRKTFDTLQDPLAKKSGNSKELTPIEEEKEKPKNLKLKLKIKKIEKSPKEPMPTLKTPENTQRSTRIRIKTKKYA
jgi:DNA-binding XRE family transcriptional regulator